MEGKFQKFSYADSSDSDTWFIFQNVDGKNEFISLVFVFTSWVIVLEGFGWWQQKINKLNKINKNSLIRKSYWLAFWTIIYEILRCEVLTQPWASIYWVSVTPIVMLLMVSQNPITCTIFRKSSTRSFRCTYQLWLNNNNNNTKSSQFLTFK